MKKVLTIAFLLIMPVAFVATETATPLVSPDKLWNDLLAGNQRFAKLDTQGPHRDGLRRTELASGQSPKVIVVSCSDSRVPPEIVFDQGLGDLFVVRTAGEVVTAVELGSIEYAVEHLGSQLIVVLGHEKCGAVTAAVQGGEAPPNIQAIIRQILPAVAKAKGAKNEVDSAIRYNVLQVASTIQADAQLSKSLKAGSLKVVGAYYELATGKVTKVE